MRKTALLRTIPLLCAVCALLLAASGATADEDKKQTLTGEYRWNARSDGGDLEAVFTPKGEAQWDVAFYFQFRGRDHVYSGTAEGTLGSGDLKGEVKNEGKNRTFTFEGSFKDDGTFKGKHAEIEGGKPFRTGTLTLK